MNSYLNKTKNKKTLWLQHIVTVSLDKQIDITMNDTPTLATATWAKKEEKRKKPNFFSMTSEHDVSHDKQVDIKMNDNPLSTATIRSETDTEVHLLYTELTYDI